MGVKSHGYRAGTRSKFRRSFRQHGLPAPSTYMQTFKIGEFVDIMVNGAVQKGMPHYFYHGKTGKVWDVTPRAVGVELLKKSKGKCFRKRIHVRIEHVRKSKCQKEFMSRVDEFKERLRTDPKARPIKREQIKPPGEMVAELGEVKDVYLLPYRENW